MTNPIAASTQFGNKVQARMDVALRDWVGRTSPAARLLGRNHTEPYTWRPFSSVEEVGIRRCTSTPSRDCDAPM
jgi:hypothetical protein